MTSAAVLRKTDTKSVQAPGGRPANDVGGSPALSRQSLLRFITCGSVDDGKSTLIGRILFEAGAVFDDQLTSLDTDSRKFGTRGEKPDYALLVDGLSAEREQGITIDVAYRYFSTPRRHFIVADTPGHEQYTRNMATGASTADLAVILIDARKGLLPQTRRHSFIVSLVGVRHVVVAVNKMDLMDYEQAVFDRIVADYQAATAGLGFLSVTFIPVCAPDGENVSTPSTHMPWYRGPSLVPFLETVEVLSEKREDDGLLLPVQWVNRPDLDFRGYSGMIARGRARKGDYVIALPSGRTSRVRDIVTPAGGSDQASAGQSVTVTLADQIDISRGDVIVAAGKPPRAHRRLKARLLWTGEAPLQIRQQFIVKLATATTNATITRLHHAIDIESFGETPCDALRMNAIGLASIELDQPLVALDYAESRELGGFILIDRVSNETVAFGFVALDHDAPARSGGAPAGADFSDRIATTLLGPAGSPQREARREQLGLGLAGGVLVGLLVFAATGSLPAAVLVALGDVLIRPLLPRLRKALARQWQTWQGRGSPGHTDGGGQS